MATLTWTEQGSGALIASGDADDYLIACDGRQIVLTRWHAGVSFPVAASQATLNAIQISGAYDAAPLAVVVITGQLKQAAQAYESGLDVPGQPGWQHGYQVPGERVVKRPGNAEHLPAPDLEDAISMAGVLFHYVGGSKELRERLARWTEHHEGDLDEQIVLWYLTECHARIEPGCELPLDWDAHPGRTR